MSVQNEYSLLRRGPEKQRRARRVREARHRVHSVLPARERRADRASTSADEAPPAGTRLAGMPAERQEQALSDKVLNRVEALDAWARDHGHTLLELAFAWLLARPVVDERDRGRDQARAGGRERGGRGVDAERRATWPRSTR